MSNRRRAMKHEYRVEVFRGGRRILNTWYATPETAYVMAAHLLFCDSGVCVTVSRDSRLLARMVKP